MPVNLTPEIIDLIVDDLRRSSRKSFRRVGRKFGISPERVRTIAIERLGYRKVSEDGLGRLELRPYIIATRHVDGVWDNSDSKIKRAREQYDVGLVEMAQAVDAETVILYSIPRQTPDAKRKVYFAREEYW